MNTSRGWRTRAGAAITAMVMAFVALMAAPAAVAAPPYTSNASIDSLVFAQSTVQSGSSAQLNGTWSLPDNAPSPAGFAVTLPAGLQGLTDSFPLLDPEGVEMGQCTVTTTQLFCDIDPTYLTANPLNVDGTFSMFVSVQTQVTESTQVTYDFGSGVTTTVTVTPSPAQCPECIFPGQSNFKYGTYDRATDVIRWTVVVNAPSGGMVGGETVTITDRLGANQQQQVTGGVTQVEVAGTNQFNAQGFPIGYQNVNAQVGLQTSTDGSGNTVATFESQAGWIYQVNFFVDATDAGASGTYTNAADVLIEGQASETVANAVVRQGGDGTGDGENLGRFSITKDVVWNGGAPLPGVTFSGTFTATPPTGPVIEGTFSVLEDGTWTSAALPTGSIVSIQEILPSGPPNVSWAAPVLSSNDFAIVGDTLTEVTLTNAATFLTGAFSAQKIVTGSGASLVPEDTTFTLEYSYPAGDGFAAGSGSLTLLADGTVATSAALPVGAVLTLSEVAPTPIANASWGTPVISPSTVTIGQDGTVAVTVTNTIALGSGTFSASKVVTGDGAGVVPANATFTLDYSYPAGQGFAAGSGSLTLPADGTVVTSPSLPIGAVLTLTEATPAPVANATWSAPVLSATTVTIGATQGATVTVTNELTLGTGTFSASKVVTGDGAGAVPASATFTLDYSYPAGPGFAAGSGSLTLPADGTVVTSPSLPIGAVVTLVEATPAPIANATWSAPELSTSTVTIGATQSATVTVTNELTLDRGTFSASKILTGDGADAVPTDATFTLDYSYPAGPGFAAGSGSLTLLADGTVATSPALPVGAVVTLVEATPAPIENAAWSAPVLSATTLTIGAAEDVTVTVTNELTLDAGTFTASKEIVGSGASLVPSSATFALDYSYPAGPGFEAGSGTLLLPANGDEVVSPVLPAGAVVTLSEATPAAVSGGTWAAARLSTTSLVIGSDEGVEVVVVTNTITANPTPSAPAPSDPASSVSGQGGTAPRPAGGLPRTGGELALGALALAGGLVAAGALLAWRRRMTEV